MTMISFRVPDTDVEEIQHWAQALGIDRSEILREALHRYLVTLRNERDAEKWGQAPLTETEQSLGSIADWGPSEEWADWDDATR